MVCPNGSTLFLGIDGRLASDMDILFHGNATIVYICQPMSDPFSGDGRAHGSVRRRVGNRQKPSSGCPRVAGEEKRLHGKTDCYYSLYV